MLHENLASIDILLIIAGSLIGSILGAAYGHSSDGNQKQKTLKIFGGIFVAVVGGGLYLYLEQIEIFTVFTIPYALGFITVGLISKIIYSKKRGSGFAIIPIRHDPQVKKWNTEYGPGFRSDDVLIVEAIDKGKSTNKKISIYCNLPEKHVKQRIDFMKKKGLLK